MASTSGGGHGGKRRNLARKRRFREEIEQERGWERCHKRIFRNESIFSRALRYNTSHKILICRNLCPTIDVACTVCENVYIACMP